MKLETETYGLFAKKKEKKPVQTGHEWPRCSSCGEPIFRKDSACRVCGAALGAESEPAAQCETAAQGGPAISRLSDEELGSKLHYRRVMRVVALAMVVPLAATAFIALVFALAEGEAIYWVLAVAALIGAVYCLLYNWGSKGHMKQLLSINVVQDALGEVFEDCAYSYENRLSGSVIEEARLISGWTSISGSDFAQGRYRGRGIEFSDIKLEKITYRTNSDGSVRKKKRVLLFKGHWLVFELGRELPASIRVIERGGRRVGQAIKGMTKGDVETENMAFNQQFRIQAEDPHTAFYILTPHFIEYIMAADAAAMARTSMCFTGSRMHIALDSGRDLFEVGGSVKDIAALRARIKSEVRYLTGILDELLQNTYLFGEENQAQEK